MGLKSKKKLFKVLEELRPTYFSGVVKEGLKHPKIQNETYGSGSFIYVYCADVSSKQLIQQKLGYKGFKITSYDPEKTISVQVSYFKGHHWDE